MSPEASILVGFDGSQGAQRALAWAVEHADAVHSPLRVCIARGDLYQLSRWADQWTAGLAQEWAEQARSQLAACRVEFDVEIADGNAAPVLIDRTTPESLVVVGSRGRGVFDGIAVGSVAQHVTRYATGPVVVVRQAALPSSRKVVAGADDLPEGLRAVDWAADFASARGMDLCVLHCPDPPVPVSGPGAADLLEHFPLLRDREARIRERVDRVKERHPALTIDVEVSMDDPRGALRRASKGAALVVVGARGHGAFRGMLLGSVGASLVAHAGCPVAVIR
jgi:nucleotide-binding universal stress UspA family protein